MPDLLPATPRNAAYRREFYRYWGRENCIVCFTAHRAEYPLFRQTLSLKCIARGTETYFVDRRRITVSDDTYLLLNEGRVYGSVLDVPSRAYSFSIFFRPGLAPEVAGGLQRNLDQALDDGPPGLPVPIEFEETLRPHDASVSPVIRYMQHSISAGVRDTHWLEEQCQFVLTRLIRAQRPRTPLSAELATARTGQRVEVLRRLERAADYMHEHLQDEISLQDIAAAAHLSRFHFLRLFRIAHGCTPVAWLRALRTRRALALAESTTLGAGEIAEKVGLSRITLWRVLRAQGAGTRELRRRPGRPASAFLGRES